MHSGWCSNQTERQLVVGSLSRKSSTARQREETVSESAAPVISCKKSVPIALHKVMAAITAKPPPKDPSVSAGQTMQPARPQAAARPRVTDRMDVGKTSAKPYKRGDEGGGCPLDEDEDELQRGLRLRHLQDDEADGAEDKEEGEAGAAAAVLGDESKDKQREQLDGILEQRGHVRVEDGEVLLEEGDAIVTARRAEPDGGDEGEARRDGGGEELREVGASDAADRLHRAGGIAPLEEVAWRLGEEVEEEERREHRQVEQQQRAPPRGGEGPREEDGVDFAGSPPQAGDDVEEDAVGGGAVLDAEGLLADPRAAGGEADGEAQPRVGGGGGGGEGEEREGGEEEEGGVRGGLAAEAVGGEAPEGEADQLAGEEGLHHRRRRGRAPFALGGKADVRRKHHHGGTAGLQGEEGEADVGLEPP
eukprot:CAMPEP_0205897608 /NCGR_PEP_ID=MMETSP1083-20121108/25586_1 /ASSEMBLY_ACC=CAM_ASM_000430 /TAXON_ID=97485 /ORGANISM="Prymnesium parvum, Strain Texoma1" /LENGTH=419 /DNA_ID=CAMNT_0053262775 /DNA_START=60 /DNA_END=1316 /DNA_ORIENTATION=+